MKLGVFGSTFVSLVTAQSTAGAQPTNLILAADGTEVRLARESEKKVFLKLWKEKKPEIWNGSGGYYKTSCEEKIFNE
jgi:hypothetical protein